MLISVDDLDQTAQTGTEPSEWRTFNLSPKDKARFRIKGLNSKAYRVAQERISEHLRLTCGNLTQVNDYEETSLAKHMTIIAYHLVTDWEGIFDKKSGTEVPFTCANMATVLKYSGDLGILMHGWILEQATDIQFKYDQEIAKSVGKPWSFSDSMQNDSDQKSSEKLESASENP